MSVASTSWKPQALSRPVMGLLYLYLTSNNTGTLLSQKVAPPDAVIAACICYILSSVTILTQNGQFLDRATIAFCE